MQDLVLTPLGVPADSLDSFVTPKMKKDRSAMHFKAAPGTFIVIPFETPQFEKKVPEGMATMASAPLHGFVTHVAVLTLADVRSAEIFSDSVKSFNVFSTKDDLSSLQQRGMTPPPTRSFDMDSVSQLHFSPPPIPTRRIPSIDSSSLKTLPARSEKAGRHFRLYLFEKRFINARLRRVAADEISRIVDDWIDERFPHLGWISK